MYSFKNTSVYVDGKGIVKTDLSFNDKIVSTDSAIGTVIDLPKNAIVLPGFIDRHIHGAYGVDAMDASVDAIKTMSYELVKEGTTSFLPTTMTCDAQDIKSALKSIREYKEMDEFLGAEVIGVHLEGPFINEKYKGAQKSDFILKPSVQLFDEFNKESGNLIKIVTVAPEADGMQDFISKVSKKGVCVSVGHSSAKFSDVLDATVNGLSSTTHTFNAQSPLHHRDVGVVGATLLLDVYAELIADTIHVSIPAMRLLVNSKPNNKIILVTDAMRAKGLADGESELGGQKVFVKNGEARLVDGTLAGSVLKMNDAIKNVVQYLAVSLEDAVDMATKNPAKSLSIFDKKGSIKEGKDADFAVIDEDFNVLMTIRGGKIVYKA